MNQKLEHPDAFLSQLLSKGGRPLKLRNLQAIHEICRTQYELGERNISVSSIGKICERDGILKARGLYNAPLADYRKLIDRWAVFAGPPASKQVNRLASDDYINRIEDPAIRALVQKVVVERNKLKAQINTLKCTTTIVVDRRPKTGARSSMSSSEFTDSERKALAKAISKEFLSGNSWREVEFGEVVNSHGRTIFDPGFATAIRKLLGQC